MELYPFDSLSLVSSLHIWLPHRNTITTVTPLGAVITAVPAIKTSIPALPDITSINRSYTP